MTTPIRVTLDEFVLEIDPVAKIHRKSSSFVNVKTKIYLPSGEVINSGGRYDGRLIDPVLQDHQLKEHGLINEETYLTFDSEGKSNCPNYQRWIDYRAVVKEEIEGALQNKYFKIKRV